MYILAFVLCVTSRQRNVSALTILLLNSNIILFKRTMLITNKIKDKHLDLEKTFTHLFLNFKIRVAMI